MKKDKRIMPVVKWVGGKRQLLSDIKRFIPKEYTSYYEPFLGGGALFFHLQPSKAVVNDINGELINLYQVIKDHVEDLIKDLEKHKNEETYFYQIRELDRDKDVYANLSTVAKASRIHYLNKTCYNGLFRVNQQGQFNSPFGRHKKPNIVNAKNLRAVSKYFNQAQIIFRCGDFEEAVEGIRKDSFVYLDPPYDPMSSSANFTNYDKGGFSRKEQERLKKLCDSLDKKGVQFLLSNAATDFIMELYKDYPIEIVRAKRLVNSQGQNRRGAEEVLVRNYE